YFIKKLSKIMPVIMIMGNHDYNARNKDEENFLESVIKLVKKVRKNVYLLKDTGTYHYGNITFGATSIKDKNRIIKAKELKNGRKVKIALYHGTVCKSTTDVGHVLNGDAT